MVFLQLGFEGWKTMGVKKRSCGESYASPHAHDSSNAGLLPAQAGFNAARGNPGAIETMAFGSPTPSGPQSKRGK
jgi:hypothetical protein